MQVEAAVMLPDDVAAELHDVLVTRPFVPGTAGPLSRRLSLRAEGDLLAPPAPNARITAADDLRVSLVSFGDLGGTVVGQVRRRLADVAAAHTPLELRLIGLSTEPARSGDRGELVAVRVAGDVDGLRALHRAVVAAVAPLGLYLDRRTFVPRVVVASAPAPSVELDALAGALEDHRGRAFVAGALGLLAAGVDHDGGAGATRLPLGAG